MTSNTIGGVVFDYDSLLPNATSPDVASTIYLRSLPSQQWVSSDAAGNQKKAITNYEYDNYDATQAGHAALLSRTGISGLDASFTSAKKTRGNVTAISRRRIQDNNRDITSYQQYDLAVNVVKAIDAQGAATVFTFTDCFGSPSDNEARTNTDPNELATQNSYALVTKVTLPTVEGSTQVSYTQYDYYTGKPVNAEDANGTVYSGYYNDDLDRPTQLVKAATDTTTTINSQTHFIYDDANHLIRTTSDRTNYDDDLLKSEVVYDGLGRTVQSRSFENGTDYILVEQTYDAMGRAWKKSNPYRPSSETAVWTTTTYDDLSRVIQVMTPDNAKVNTSYSGNKVTAKDQALKDRESTTDAFGRLVQVIEDPGTGGLNYQTAYAYDVLDNLLTVTHGSQTRTFTYDSLKRLTQVVNPESGTLKYEYDDNGNLTRRIDPRKVTTTPLVYVETTFAYDALNRVTSKSYNDGTPNILYKYDAQALPSGAPNTTIFQRGESMGRLVSVTYGGTAAGSYYGFDALGRVVQKVQQTDGINYQVDATYNRAGAMLSETYPSASIGGSRRVVTHTFDGAGRPASLSTSGASVTGIQYASHGALSQQTYGTLTHQISSKWKRLRILSDLCALPRWMPGASLTD